MMDWVFWATALIFLYLRIRYHFLNKQESEDWNRRHMDWESL